MIINTTIIDFQSSYLTEAILNVCKRWVATNAEKLVSYGAHC